MYKCEGCHACITKQNMHKITVMFSLLNVTLFHKKYLADISQNRGKGSIKAKEEGKQAIIHGMSMSLNLSSGL